ncbi:MAG: ABC transporter substrate-binding protein [Candidatus Peregrinibacteria bacterium]|nr:ABC transporter substrate-binding protein [Candidatus Peregrinibacteria bacterium]
MKLLKWIIKVFQSYAYGDKIISVLCVLAFLLMILKMMVFPYGFFSFGASDTYAEGIVSKNGIQNINPLFVDYNDADRDVSSLVFSGLMKYDPSKKAVVDDIGTMTLNENKTEYTFKIKTGVKWHDGKAFSVDDVYFTYHDIVMDKDFPNEILKANFDGVTVEKVDESTIKFKLLKPNIFFTTNLTTGILPKHLLNGVKSYDLLQHPFNKLPVGTGPYMVTSPVESFPDGRTQITLTISPYYYNPISEITNLRIIAYPTADLLMENMSSYNASPRVTGGVADAFKENLRFKLLSYELPQYTAVFFNLSKDPIKDNKKLRIGLQKAINKDKLVGEGGVLKDKVRVDTPMMELDQTAWGYKSDKTEAEGALKDAGYTFSREKLEDMRYGKDGNPLKLNLISRLYDEGTPQYDEIKATVAFLKDSWEEVGVGIDVEFLSQDDFKTRIMTRKYDILLVGQSLGYNLDTYSFWHSSQANATGQNFSDYKSFAVDSLIEDVRSVFNQEKRNKEVGQIATFIRDEVPAVFLYRPVYYYATDSKVSGILMDGATFASDRFFNIGEWKFER